MTLKLSTQQLNMQHWLSDSWLRSQGAGLSEASNPEEMRLDRGALEDRHFHHKQLIELVQKHALPLFSQLMSHTKSRLILSDSEGYVLCHWGVSQYSDKLANVALDVGVNWQEQHKGTNAIGTALTAQQTISVVGEQHFIKQHRFMSCTASPIFSPSGELIAAIDITTEQQKHTQQTLLLVSSLAQQVETALLCHLPHSHYRIDLAEEASLIHSGWQGIVIADSEGKILGTNSMAKKLLHAPSLGEDIGRYIGNKWSENDAISQHRELHLKTQAIKPTKPQVLGHQVAVRFKDPKLERAWQQANKVVSRCIPLLVLGETGVGKEQFVTKLHSQSQRRNQSLVAVNCAALPADLVESELFGYQAGAFTGANRNGYLGKIRQADGGFLFLDEIGEMPLATQSRLLRVLQEKEVTPVGSNRSYKVDIQIVAATHTDLQQQVDNGQFRLDLFYRLNGLQVTLPPLRLRSDIERIIHKLHRKYRVREQCISRPLLEKLLAYQWPGNLRELDNLMQVVCLLSEGEAEISWQHLPDHLQQTLAQEPVDLVCDTDLEGRELENVVNSNIIASYAQFQGNVTQCAKHLGVSRNTLYRKLKVLGIKS
ncbi:sigma-54-dependent Fis family transcriptional regulator [Shewanella eurypsychrophilus]|uniref:Sigma-54-dependent Fis family transcriptional regulator n=1 Tax=Shewanella eurypsychrophilus TaxID=2593656 RepID=A0ABX6V0X3_9GAMM|nr:MULTISPECIES: sigma-54-dependent Fis family transcriptional regulator [Shewanella]QFU20667.1 GAF domain-containing protein [Shewanella sp. YLB-09]QFU20947.1 GAF domain-containing protein [Shewanella sp. YLB-09]QPG56235.1 sigma-54-dependent Fis family transcriptional regulator [Shewanella eurypsychrophilus]